MKTMNTLCIRTIPLTTTPYLQRCFKSTSPPNTNKKNSCDETDCCGKPIYAQPKPTIYIERACHPCSFFTWKPKIPILVDAPPLKDGTQKNFKKKHCYAGMKSKDKCLEEIKAEAAECWKCNAPIPYCPPPPPPPPPKEEEPECDRTIPIPAADWDVSLSEPKKDKCDDIQ